MLTTRARCGMAAPPERMGITCVTIDSPDAFVAAVSIIEGFRRLEPVRRLSRTECDLLGYEGPLVLSVRQVRWLIGPWRRTKDYVVVRHPNTVVMECTKTELQELGVDPDVD